MGNRISNRRSRGAMLAAAVVLVPGLVARADTFVWTAATTGGDNTTITSPANWTNITSVPTNVTGFPGPGTSLTGGGDIAIFNDIGQNNATATITVPATLPIGSIEFGDASQFYPPANTSPLTLTNNVTIGATGTTTAINLYGTNLAGATVGISRDESNTGLDVINNPIVLQNTTATGNYPVLFNINGPTGSLTLNGSIGFFGANTMGITKNGDGTLVLAAANNYAGQTFVNAGTLFISNLNGLEAVSGNVELGSSTSPANASIISIVGGVSPGFPNAIDVVNTGSTSTQLTVGSGAQTTAGFGVINLYHDVILEGNVLNSNQTFFSGNIQTGAANVLSGNVITSGTGIVLQDGSSTYYGNTIVEHGTLSIGNADALANHAAATAATYTAGATTIQLASTTGLTTGMNIAGPGIPIATTTLAADTITAINTATNTVTLARAIDPTFTTTAPINTTLYFGTANPLGLSTAPILLGDANTTANGYSAVFLCSNRALYRPLTVTNNPTTGTYYIGSRNSAFSTPSGFLGQITLDQPATMIFSAGTSGLVVSGGVVAGVNAPITLTFGSTNVTAFYTAVNNTFNTVTAGNVTAANGNVTFNGLPIADGAGKVSMVVNAGLASFQVPETYSGNTTVNGGTLQFRGTGGIPNSPAININSTASSIAIIQAANGTVASPFVFSASQLVEGNGTFTGSNTATPPNGVVQFNGTVQVGETINTPGKVAGLLTLNAGSILNGSLHEDLTAPSTSDQLAFGVGATSDSTANLGGTLTVTNPNNIAFAPGQSYQLLSYGTNEVIGSFSAVNLPALPAATPALGWNTSSLYTTGVIGISSSLIWNNTGAGATGDGLNWDTSNFNWNAGAGPTTYADGNIVTFNDANNGHFTVDIGSTVSPGQIFVNTANTYTFAGAGAIAGNAGLTKTGTGALMITDTGPNLIGSIVVNQGTLTSTVAGGLGNGNLVIVNPTGTSGTSADATTVNSNGSIGNTATLTVLSNSATAIGTVNFNGTVEAVGSVAGTGIVALTNVAGTSLTVGANNLSTTFSGTITDNATGLGSLTKVGTGALNLLGTNTYGGGTTLNGGSLMVGSTGAIGTTGSISFGGGTLAYSSVNQTDYSGRFSTHPGQLTSIDTNSQNVTFASSLSSSGGSLTKLGLGTLTLTGTNPLTGGTNINAGILSLGSLGALGPATTITFGGGTLQFSALNTTDYSSQFSTAGSQPFSIDTNGLAVNFATNLSSSSGSLTKLGTGTLTINQTSFGGGNITVNQGTLTSSINSAYIVNTVIVNPTGTSATTADAATLISNEGLASNSTALTVNTTSATAIGTAVLNGAIESIGSLAGTGASVISLTNPAGGLLNIGGLSTSTTYAGKINDNSTGKGGLTFSGPGTLDLTGASTYGGGTNITGGTLVAGVANALGTAGTITFGGGTLEYAGNTTDYSARISTGAGEQISINTNSQSPTYATALTSAGGTLTKFGAGTLTLSKGVSFGTNGNILVTGGTLSSTQAGGFGVGSFIATTNNNSFTIPNFTSLPVTSIVINSTLAFTSATNLQVDGLSTNTITVNLLGTTETLGSLASSTTGGGTGKVVLDNAAGTVLTFGNSTDTAINGTIADTGTGKGSLVYVGSGTVTIANTTTYGAGTTINSGTITTGTSRISDLGTGPVIVNPTGISGTSADAAVLDLNIFNATSLTGAVTVNTNSATAVGTINIADSVGSYEVGSLAGTGTVVLGSATLGPVAFNTGNATNTTFSGSMTDGSTTMGSVLVYQGTGTFTLSGANSYGGGTTATKGALVFGKTASFPAVTNLSVSAGAVAAATNHGANPVTVLQVNTLTNSGLVDLSNDAMSVHSGTLSAIATMVAAGFNSGWTGTTGITSSAAATDPTHGTGLGVILNDNGVGVPLYGASNMFDGTSPSLDDVLVKYTYYGDTNLKGHVAASDYVAIDNAFNNNSNIANTPLTGWANGDFNYDGVINGDDYALIDNSYNTQTVAGLASISAGPAEMIASNTDQIAGSATSSAVPEPTTLGVIGIGAIGLISRRRRRHFVTNV